ncbi:nucleotide exchange factor GrpE [Clostridium minihomine]|uniref:nucleotide exchange factor GrpE n=1 Tax=Clostridium minihomine TaxID=2045012 RepID=UPI000C789CEF|nr:nucleotide exchange factor GrpE [Clostridium minihomine]
MSKQDAAQQAANQAAQEENAVKEKEKQVVNQPETASCSEAPGNEPADSLLQELKAQLEQTNAELLKQKDLLLRTAAEYDNYRKRTERERTMVYTDATADAIEKFLPICDNLERALAQQGGTVEDLHKGVEMVYGQMNDVLTKMGVAIIGQEGEAFNPELHNAVSHIENEKLGENVVAEVLQKGYRIGDRIVRYAIVQVAN